MELQSGHGVADRQTDRPTVRQAEKYTGRRTDSQTHGLTKGGCKIKLLAAAKTTVVLFIQQNQTHIDTG